MRCCRAGPPSLRRRRTIGSACRGSLGKPVASSASMRCAASSSITRVGECAPCSGCPDSVMTQTSWAEEVPEHTRTAMETHANRHKRGWEGVGWNMRWRQRRGRTPVVQTKAPSQATNNAQRGAPLFPGDAMARSQESDVSWFGSTQLGIGYKPWIATFNPHPSL